MIILLEGINGVGKTTYAEMLSKILKIQYYHALKNGNMDVHWGEKGEKERALREVGAPLNTHIEDLYLADMLKTFNINAVIDRSMPSAIAYGKVERLEYLKTAEECVKVYSLWEKMMPLDVLYVYMLCDYNVAKERCKNRKWPLNKIKYDKLKKVFAQLFQKIRYEKMIIDTTIIHPQEGINRILGSRILSKWNY